MAGETLARWDVLNELLETSDRGRFLEIGVQAGVCGSRIRAREKWGVDPEPRALARTKYARFFQCTSDEFFEDLPAKETFDVVFIDGLHHAEQTMRDAEHALKHLAPEGVIVLHDCNPQTELAQRVPRETGVWNGDCWKTLVRLRQRQDLQAFTIDADHGLGIVVRAPNPEPLREVPAVLTYATLERDRERLIGLVPPVGWAERIAALRLGRLVVVSAILGGRDAPMGAPTHDVDEYLMFTDGPAPPGWTTERLPTSDDPRRAARRIKTLLLDLVDADLVVWVDGRIKPTGVPLRPLIRRALRNADVACYPHPWRTCAYQEARECARLGLISHAEADAQAAAYQEDGHPSGAGLWNTMVLARRRSDSMVEFGRAWWHEVSTRTIRDQISFPYLLRKFGIECGRLGADVYRAQSSREFLRGKHLQ
jgi:SAM-dependent methyltransferase